MRKPRARFGLLPKIILFLVAILIPLAAVTWYVSVRTLRERMTAAAMEERIANVPDDRWGSPSPCEGWSARDVVQHVTQVVAQQLRDVAARARLELVEPGPASLPALAPPEGPHQKRLGSDTRTCWSASNSSTHLPAP